jgi:predicted GIY-YIG superfamily endonuclease
MVRSSRKIVKAYARMWPREIFDAMEGRKLLISDVEELHSSGVYILYRDDHPYYIGKAIKLSTRLHSHANMSTDRYFNFWNFFSVFAVPRKHMDEVEGILIASMTTANSAVPRIKEVKLPKRLARILRDARRRKLGQ